MGLGGGGWGWGGGRAEREEGEVRWGARGGCGRGGVWRKRCGWEWRGDERGGRMGKASGDEGRQREGRVRGGRGLLLRKEGGGKRGGGRKA